MEELDDKVLRFSVAATGLIHGATMAEPEILGAGIVTAVLCKLGGKYKPFAGLLAAGAGIYSANVAAFDYNMLNTGTGTFWALTGGYLLWRGVKETLAEMMIKKQEVPPTRRYSRPTDSL